MPMSYRENNPLAQDKGKQKGAEPLSGWTSQNTPDKIRWGGAYSRGDWALKTNERSSVKQIPSLGGFSSYIERGEEAKRWARTLYNHPINSVVDYFIVNICATSDRIDIESGGRLKYK